MGTHGEKSKEKLEKEEKAALWGRRRAAAWRWVRVVSGPGARAAVLTLCLCFPCLVSDGCSTHAVSVLPLPGL